MPVPKTLRSTNEVLQQANAQIHTVAGLSYDTVNFPLLDKVATKYKSFEVPKQNGTTCSLRIPATWSKDSQIYILLSLQLQAIFEMK